jgi:hypothetical protein
MNTKVLEARWVSIKALVLQSIVPKARVNATRYDDTNFEIL